MGKKSKGKLSKKSKPSKNISKWDSSIPSQQYLRSVNYKGSESVTYTAVPLSETEDPNAQSYVGAAPLPSKSKQSTQKDGNAKKKSKRRIRNDSDDDSIELERKVKMKVIC